VDRIPGLAGWEARTLRWGSGAPRIRGTAAPDEVVVRGVIIALVFADAVEDERKVIRGVYEVAAGVGGVRELVSWRNRSSWVRMLPLKSFGQESRMNRIEKKATKLVVILSILDSCQ
jgi:hypothetical protein